MRLRRGEPLPLEAAALLGSTMPMHVVEMEAASHSEGQTETTPLILPSVTKFDSMRPFKEATNDWHGRCGPQAEMGAGPSGISTKDAKVGLGVGCSITRQPDSLMELLNDGGPEALDRMQPDAFTMSYLTRNCRTKLPIRWYQCICDADPPKMCRACCMNRQDMLVPEVDPLLAESYKYLHQNGHHKTIIRK
ncbi:MAG: hypothetical protein KVP17_004907 [Porospora cf. gigantea B]|uniref:uncharacterized protein n=2 Tax=Porospora cf. gigantea B TaxID=2853592 RepID=UPI003571869C|nr:MAG: hypothetical protein KVP17_004907 [Porospora cf. gigantea B]